MNREKIVTYASVGEVILRRNNRAKNLSIRVTGEGKVKVTVPRGCSYRAADRFIRAKSQWIRRKQLQVRERNTLVPGVDGEGTVCIYRGEIHFQTGSNQAFSYRGEGGLFTVVLPVDYSQRKEVYREALSALLAEIGLVHAREVLPKRFHQLAERSGLPYSRMTVRRMRSRWGSCSAKNSISLSSGLVFLGEDLIDYVCLHELAHTKHKNHSREYWAYLEQLLPDAKEKRKALRNQSIIA